MKLAVLIENGHPAKCLELQDSTPVPAGYEVMSISKLEQLKALKPEGSQPRLLAKIEQAVTAEVATVKSGVVGEAIKIEQAVITVERTLWQKIQAILRKIIGCKC